MGGRVIRWLATGLLAALVLSCSSAPVHASTSRVRWSRGFVGVGATDTVTANAVRAAGDALVLGGAVKGATDFGCGAFRSRGGPDGVVGSFAGADGACRWIAQVGGVGVASNVAAVATDVAGDVYAAGWFSGTVTLDDMTLTSAGGTDAFLAKYDGASGALRWARRLGGSGQERLSSVVVAGDVVAVTGYATGAGTAGGTDVLLAAYGLDGAPRWSRMVGGAGADLGTALAPGPSGGVVVAGTFSGSVDFGGGSASSAGGVDVFLAAYDSAGAALWARTAGGPGDDTATAVAAAPDGSFVLTGTLAEAGVPAVVVAKYSPAGAPIWSRAFRSPTLPLFGGAGRAVAVVGDGTIALTGSITDDLDFGGGALAGPYTADVFLAELSPAGEHRSSQRFPASFRDEGEGVAFDSSGRLVVAGVFASAVDFGNGALAGGGGGTKAFLVVFDRLAPVPTDTATVSASATETPTSTAVATETATASSTETATPVPTETDVPTATASATETESVIPTASATHSPRPTDSAVPTATETTVPTATATATAIETPTPAVPRICDVTGNGTITSLDATWVLQYVAGVRPLDDEQRRRADASGNGGVSTLDAVLILRWQAGQHEQAPRCGREL